MSDYAEDRFHRKLDAALARAGERDEVGIGAWANHDDPRDEWPNASDWTVSGIAGMLADANDDFWTAYHRVCAERGDDAADALGDQYKAMARRLLTTPALADWLDQRIEQAKAEALRVVRLVEADMAEVALKAWRSADARRGLSDHDALLAYADTLTRWSERFRMAFDGEDYRDDREVPHA